MCDTIFNRSLLNHGGIMNKALKHTFTIVAMVLTLIPNLSLSQEDADEERRLYCKCNDWGSITVKTNSGVVQIKCPYSGNPISVGVGEMITIAPTYTCTGPRPCLFTSKLRKDMGPVFDNAPTPFSFSSAGNHSVMLYGFCDGQICACCQIPFIVRQTCECKGPWSNVAVSWQTPGGAPVQNNVSCNQTISVPPGIPIKISATYPCTPLPLCPTTYTWSYNHTPRGSVAMPSPGIVIPALTAGVPVTVTIKAYCGGRLCNDSCKIIIRPCKIDEWVINTGFNHATNTVYPFGAQDQYWKIVWDNHGGPIRSSFIMDKSSDYYASGWQNPLPNSQWIGLATNPGGEANTWSQWQYKLEIMFCLKEVTNAKIEFDYRVDNTGSVLLNNAPITGSSVTDNFNQTPKHVVINSGFVVGVNRLTISVLNSARVTGLNVKGKITGVGLEMFDCCRP